jgi:hypothetical protein
MSEEKRPEPEFYRVTTSSMLIGQKIYREGELIPRGEAGLKIDYALGQGLIELYEPDEEEEVKPSVIRGLAGLLPFRAKRA